MSRKKTTPARGAGANTGAARGDLADLIWAVMSHPELPPAIREAIDAGFSEINTPDLDNAEIIRFYLNANKQQGGKRK